MYGKLWVRSCAFVTVVALSTCLSGCTPTEESDVINALQAALTELQQNRSLTEQFVRDIKTTVNPSDPSYAEVMDSYQNARESYDRYLDGVEESRKNEPVSRSLRGSTPRDVENATADFLADATSILKPSVNTRRIPFQRAVVLPEALQATLQKVPKKAREKIISDFDDRVRWRSWTEL